MVNIQVIEELRQQRERELKYTAVKPRATPNQRVLVTQLWHDPAIGTCADIYNDIRHEVSQDGILIQDRTELTDGASRVDLLMAVQDAATVSRRDGEMHRVVVKALTQHRESNQLTVGVAPLGPEFARAADIIADWLRPDTPTERFFVEGVADEEALRELMWRWVQRIIRRDPRRRVAAASDFDSLASVNRSRNQYFDGSGML
jgi:hypothetical protein